MFVKNYCKTHRFKNTREGRLMQSKSSLNLQEQKNRVLILIDENDS